MSAVLQFFHDVLHAPAALIGVVALIGLAVQKKSFADVLCGTIKTILGFIVLGGGTALLLEALVPLNHLFRHTFSAHGIVPNNEAAVSLALKLPTLHAASIVLIMAFGMLANILIARFTRLKYIFLTGHHAFYMACLIGVVLTAAGFRGTALVAVGALWQGLVMAAFPALAQGYMRRITGSDDVALGHFGTVGYVLSGAVGQWAGKGSPSTEEMRLPNQLGFLRDSSVSIALTMMAVYLVLVLCTGRDTVTALSGGQHYVLYAVMQAMTFSAGVFVILQGVRLLLAEIVPAFTGFSERLAPDAKPALDCPIVFPYAPNAVFVGFLASFAGGLTALAALGVLHWALILPGVAPHFFCGATAGVFGNATGGRRGAILGAFAHGVLITFLPVWLLPMLGEAGMMNATFSDSDFAVTGIVLGAFAANTAQSVMAGGIVVILAALALHHRLAPRKPNS